MKIVLFGNDLFSAQALQGIVDSAHQVAAIVCGERSPSMASGRLWKMAREMNIPVVADTDPNSAQVTELLEKIKPDLIISVHLSRLFQPRTCALAARGAINVHPSLLPKYRGLSPFEQAILHGDSETGLTVHCINAQPDTGDIIMQQRLAIGPDIDLFRLQRKMLPLYRQLTPEALRLIELPGFRPLKQPDDSLPCYGRITVKDRRIQPEWKIDMIDRCIRAFTKPGKGALYEDKIVWRASFALADQGSEFVKKNVFGPGAPEDRLVIRGKDGFLISDDFSDHRTHL